MNTQTKILNHLQKLVGFYPASDKGINVRDALLYCKKVLVATGQFKDLEITEHHGVPSLYASTQGTKTPALLLQGHIDVVPAPEELRKLRQHGDRLSGRGVYDMLFAVASYLTLAESLGTKLQDLDVGIMLTGDEEVSGANGVKRLVEEGYIPELCILPDGGDSFGDLSVAAKGIYSTDIIANGVAHHASRPWEGDGAGNKLIRLLHELLENFDHTDRSASSICVTQLAAGDAINKGPREAAAHLDIRFIDKTEEQRIKALIRSLCQKYQAKTVSVLEANDFNLNIEHGRVEQFLESYKEYAGKPITFSKAPGSSDARFFAAAGVPVLMFRPDGGGAHGDSEELSLSSFLKFHGLLQQFVLQTATIKQRELV
jgi:succinyl-diaminopimelate desuccinylase